MNVSEVYEGEIKSSNRITGEIEFDFDGKQSDKIVGYIAYFKLINGFEKILYMTTEEVMAHGKKFSKSFYRENGLWQTDPHSMCLKTVFKRLLSKYGILSIEMQTAFKADQAVVTQDDNIGEPSFDYIDAEGEIVDDTAESDEQPDTAKDVEQEVAPLESESLMEKHKRLTQNL